MPRAQCYYEILGIQSTATSDEIKKAYRSAALIWHPDKNHQNAEEAHTKFQCILKAYETLSDSRERDWYDRHKDQILAADGEPDELLNLFQFFSSACYANFDDEEDGFYTVYKNVFKTISEEEQEYLSRKTTVKKVKNCDRKKRVEDSFPTFGNSSSDYDEIVGPFYAFWSAFCTQITFDHLDKYKTTEAENRRVVRLMEKENKKIKEAARKERNQNVRNLVEFIKKRDKRVIAHRAQLEQQNEINRQKTAEKQRLQRERLQIEKNAVQYKPTAFENMEDIEEQLRQLENDLDEDDYYSKKGKRKNAKKYESTDEEDEDEEVLDVEGEGVDGEDEEDKVEGGLKEVDQTGYGDVKTAKEDKV